MSGCNDWVGHLNWVRRALERLKKKERRASLRRLKHYWRDLPGVQWLRICLPMQGIWILSLVKALGSRLLWGNLAHALQQRRAPARCNQRKLALSNEDPGQPKVNNWKQNKTKVCAWNTWKGFWLHSFFVVVFFLSLSLFFFLLFFNSLIYQIPLTIGRL